jgi:hypothetical protein
MGPTNVDQVPLLHCARQHSPNVRTRIEPVFCRYLPFLKVPHKCACSVRVCRTPSCRASRRPSAAMVTTTTTTGRLKMDADLGLPHPSRGYRICGVTLYHSGTSSVCPYAVRILRSFSCSRFFVCCRQGTRRCSWPGRSEGQRRRATKIVGRYEGESCRAGFPSTSFGSWMGGSNVRACGEIGRRCVVVPLPPPPPRGGRGSWLGLSPLSDRSARIFARQEQGGGATFGSSSSSSSSDDDDDDDDDVIGAGAAARQDGRIRRRRRRSCDPRAPFEPRHRESCCARVRRRI